MGLSEKATTSELRNATPLIETCQNMSKPPPFPRQESPTKPLAEKIRLFTCPTLSWMDHKLFGESQAVQNLLCRLLHTPPGTKNNYLKHLLQKNSMVAFEQPKKASYLVSTQEIKEELITSRFLGGCHLEVILIFCVQKLIPPSPVMSEESPNFERKMPPKLKGSRGTGTPMFTPIMPAVSFSLYSWQLNWRQQPLRANLSANG